MGVETGSFALKGLRQAGLWPLDPDDDTVVGDGFLLPYPKKAEFTEDQEVKDTPGADVTADKSVNIKGGTLVLGLARLKLSQIASMVGSSYTLTGTSPNQVLRMKRKTTDVAPYFLYEGRVRYIGSEYPSGDFHMKAYKGKIIGTPKLSNQTGEYADLEFQLYFEERSDGEFYDYIVNETGVALAETVDVTPPTISSVTPADNAADVAVGADVVIVFNEAIFWDPDNFTLQAVTTPGTTITDVTCVKSISTDHLTVTLNPSSNLAAATAHNLHVSGAVRDLAGNYIAAPANYQFTTAA